MDVGCFIVNEKAPEWGIGKVLEKLGSDKLRVFFEFVGEKTLLGSAAALKQVDPVPEHPVLGRLGSESHVRDFQPFQNLEAEFLRQFPAGFKDPEYLAAERDYKIEASALMRESLSEDTFRRLLDDGSYEDICERARAVINQTNLIFPNEKMALNDGLKKGEEFRKLFAERLCGQLYGEAPLQERFDAFVSALDELDATKWTTSTYFLSLNEPDKYPFVKPAYFQRAAKAYAFDLGYTVRPSWATYERIIEFSEYVRGLLAKQVSLVPRDMIDVQGFIWCSLQD